MTHAKRRERWAKIKAYVDRTGDVAQAQRKFKVGQRTVYNAMKGK